jgi:hypothetical protein
MIHDLTRDSVFHNETFPLNRIMLTPNFEKNEPYRYEALLTGDAFERMSKRFVLDYESDQELCDCCGGPLLKKPWAFENEKLCKRCNDELEKNYGASSLFELKPWEFEPEHADKPTDNIYLWD